MRGFLRHRSNRWGFDGWAVQVKGAPRPLEWTTCTTRAEAREEKAAQAERLGYLLRDLEVVKVKIRVEAVGEKE